MTIELALMAENFREETVQSLASSICTTINNETDFVASMGEQKSELGSKGDPITVGTILLAVLGTGGGTAALINVFKSYVDRSKELTIRLKKQRDASEEQDGVGKKQDDFDLEITSRNIDTTEIKLILDELLTKG